MEWEDERKVGRKELMRSGPEFSRRAEGRELSSACFSGLSRAAMTAIDLAFLPAPALAVCV